MAMVNVNNLLNIKDSRWLQLEVCREFQRNKCSRPDTECKFAHPPVNVEVQNGRVTACYDSIKGRCNREKPPCKYFHPPLHLKDQLLINGRNHLALKNALMQQMGLAPGQAVVPGQVPAVATNPYLGVTNQYNPYFATGPLVSLVSDPTGGGVMSPLGVPQPVQQKVQRADRLEHCSNSPSYDLWTKRKGGKSKGTGNIPPLMSVSPHGSWPNGGNNIWEDGTVSQYLGLPQKLHFPTYPGMVTYKRPADKGGVPVYQPANSASAAAYQHLMQLQQPFVPVSSASIQHNATAVMAAAASVASAGGTSSGHEATGGILSLNGTGSESSGVNSDGTPKRKGEAGDESTELLDNGNGLGSGSGNELDEEAKGESAVKRMRVNVGASASIQQANNINANAASAAQVIAQNNAAYVAAAQSYHNALAAMSYTGVSLQTKQTPQATAQIQQGQHSFQGAAAVLQQHSAFQQQQQQNQQQHQQQQQQQLIQQYQAMAAAALAGQGQQQQQQAMSMGMNPAAAGFQFAAMNPYLAALPQLAAAQRAQFLQQQQGGGGLHGSPYGQAGLAAGLQGAGPPGAQPGFPFGLQLGGGAGNANLQHFQQNQQQALLAAYGQFARGPVPVVSAAPSLTQQLYVTGNAAAAANGGVKRMRPA